MPWEVQVSPMEMRLKFVVEALGKTDAIAELCRRFGVSRRVGYKWIHRFIEGGANAMEDRPPVARTAPHRISEEVEMLILWARLLKSAWGPKKLRPWLEGGELGYALPAVSTFGNVLARHEVRRNRVRRRREVPRYWPSLVTPRHPNDLWCIDFKGDFRLRNGERCYPLTLEDAVSRYWFLCEAMNGTRHDTVRPALERAFRKHGLPLVIRSDNGVPFVGTSALAGLSSLSVWLARLGVWHERSRKGNPQDNGRLERLHGTLKNDTTVWPKQNLRQQQRAFDEFRVDYNDERPHEALGFRVPAEVYVPSSRRFPRRLPEFEYDVGTDVRRVASGGFITWRGHTVFLAKALGGERVGVTVRDDGQSMLSLGRMPIGVLDEESLQVKELEPTHCRGLGP